MNVVSFDVTRGPTERIICSPLQCFPGSRRTIYARKHLFIVDTPCATRIVFPRIPEQGGWVTGIWKTSRDIIDITNKTVLRFCAPRFPPLSPHLVSPCSSLLSRLFESRGIPLHPLKRIPYIFLGQRVPRHPDRSSKKMENCPSTNVARTLYDTTLSTIVAPWKIRRSLDLVGSSKSNFSTSGGTNSGRQLAGEAHCADISTKCVVSSSETRSVVPFFLWCASRRFHRPVQ